MLGVLLGLGWLGCVVWVGVDATRLGARRGAVDGGFLDMGVLGWVLSALFFWWLGIVLYAAVHRPQLVARHRALSAGLAYGGPHVAIPHQPVYGNGHPQTVLPGRSPGPSSPRLLSAPPTAPPQLSPDGQWWWDGVAWVPAAART